jgi:hypothetical protein
VTSVLSLIPGKAWLATIPVAKETSMPRPQPIRRHPDLFAYQEPKVPIAASARAELLALVSALLAETLMAIAGVEARDENNA